MKEKKIRKVARSITVGFLDILLALAENFVITMDRKELYKAVYGYRENEWSVENIRKYFDSLKRRGYLEIEKNGRRESIKFTNKAKLAMFDKISDKITIEKKYYFVSFDIPERLRRERDSFRRAIKRLGFREAQKSLWVCNRSLGEFVELAAEEYKVSNYVVYLIVEASNIDDALQNILLKN